MFKGFSFPEMIPINDSKPHKMILKDTAAAHNIILQSALLEVEKVYTRDYVIL